MFSGSPVYPTQEEAMAEARRQEDDCEVREWGVWQHELNDTFADLVRRAEEVRRAWKR